MPEVLFCWVCGEAVPALPEAEAERLDALIGAVTLRLLGDPGGLPAAPGRSIYEPPAFEAASRECLGLTGRPLGTACRRPYHRAGDFGPPCPGCGRALRSARSRLCHVCGWREGRDEGGRSRR